MTYISSAPYPPVVDSLTPAVVKGENIKVYFTFSAYTSISEIRRDAIMVSIANRYSNESVVIVGKNNNSSILFCPLKVEEDGRYYIEINSRMIQVTSGEIYKIQLRFCSASCTASVFNLKTTPSNYSDYISEWSSVTLIKIIGKPQLRLKQFEGGDEHSVYLIPTINLVVLGELYFSDSVDGELLSSYYIEIFQGGDLKATEEDEKIISSEMLYPNSFSQNVINYVVKTELTFNKNYLLRVHYNTTSGYEAYEDFYFFTASFLSTKVKKPTIEVRPDDDRGLIQIHISSSDNKEYQGCFVLRRASSIDEFSVWEDLKFFYYDEERIIEETLEDYLIQSGIYYKYNVIPIPRPGHRSFWEDENIENNLNGQDNAVICNFDDIKLIGNKDDFFSVKYDAEIQNFQYTVVESKTDTLGGKYPFIRRNGDTYYRQFSLGGLITHFCIPGYPERYTIDNSGIGSLISIDGINVTKEEETFEKKRYKYVESNSEIVQRLYEEDYYGKDSSLNEYNDYLLEKGYRDNIIKYLYENNIRLFKSPTEGNILIKLMNISLTPNATLSRHIYNFTSTAFEIDDFSIANCIKYGIWDSGEREEVSTSSITTFPYVGQIRIDMPQSTDTLGSPLQKIDIYEMIQEQIKKQTGDSYVDLDKIVWLKFSFLSAPEYFSEGEDGKPAHVVPARGASSESTSDISSWSRDFTYTKNFPLSTDYLKPEVFEKGYQYIASFREIAYLAMKSSFWDTEGITIPDIDNYENWDKNVPASAGVNQDSYALYRRAVVQAMTAKGNNNNSFYFIDYLINDVTISKRLMALLKEVLYDKSDLMTSASAQSVLRYSAGFVEDQLLDIYRAVGYPKNGYWMTGANGPIHMNPADINSNFALTLLRGSMYEFSDIYEGNEELKKIFQFNVGLALIIGEYCGFGTIKTSSNSSETEEEENLVSSRMDDSIAVGYKVYINDTSLLVAPHGRYELTDKDTNIYQIDIERVKANAMKCYIDYAAMCFSNTIDASSRTLKSVYRYYLVGQIHQELTTNLDIINIIQNKYKKTSSDSLFGDLIKRQILCVPYVSIEAEPYTISAIATPIDGESSVIHNINDTGVLTLYDEASAIKSLKLSPYSQDVKENGEIIHSVDNALQDILINYICLIQEARY